MKINRTCKVCGNSFIAIKITQFFCRRKCFKRDYYLRTKEIIQNKEQNPNYPVKKCNFCNISSQLNFDPVKNPELFDAWACPMCGVSNKVVWRTQSSPKSYEIISCMMVSISQSFSSSVTYNATYQQKEIYKLPIATPGHVNPSIVVMTCDKLNILDLQKKDRKKIVFS